MRVLQAVAATCNFALAAAGWHLERSAEFSSWPVCYPACWLPGCPSHCPCTTCLPPISQHACVPGSRLPACLLNFHPCICAPACWQIAADSSGAPVGDLFVSEVRHKVYAKVIPEAGWEG